MKSLLWAFNFLTIIPFCKSNERLPAGHNYIVCWFPVVGFCIGLVLAFSAVLLGFILPVYLFSAFVLVIYIVITGALHLDGFADTCDGIWGGWNKEKRLEIMKDSHTGSFGVVGLICLLGFKYLCIVGVGKNFHELQPDMPVLTSDVINIPQCIVLLNMPVIGRWAQVIAAGFSSYARSQSGTGGIILDGTAKKHVVAASILPLILFLFFYKIKGIILLLIIVFSVFIWILYMKKKIGGMTGDTLGATNEIGELVFLLSLYGVFRV